jgi:hypothetical protein
VPAEGTVAGETGRRAKCASPCGHAGDHVVTQEDAVFAFADVERVVLAVMHVTGRGSGAAGLVRSAIPP